MPNISVPRTQRVLLLLVSSKFFPDSLRVFKIKS